MKKVAVIGLDGACFELIDPLVAQGHLPNIERLIREGVKGPLRSTIPPMTAAAWTSFMTGKNPGKHGVFDFRRFRHSSYTSFDESFVTSGDFAGDTLFDIIGSSGLKVASVRVPVTYPAWKVNGTMISGYPSPPRGKLRCYPEEIAAEIEDIAVVSIDKATGGSPQKQMETVGQIIDTEMRLVERLLDRLSFDFFMFVSGLPDVAHHRFWRFTDPSSSVFPEGKSEIPATIISDFYRRLDKAVGQLIDRLDGFTIVIMSDHGGGARPDKLLNLNAWLSEAGLLAKKGGRSSSSREKFGSLLARTKGSIPFKETVRKLLPKAAKEKITGAINLVEIVDWTGTKAYRVPMYHPVDGINLNVRGRQPQGMVEPGTDYEALRSQIIERLSQLTDPDTGKKVVEKVSRKEDVYQGPNLEQIPDIIVMRSGGYDGGPGFDNVIEPTPRASLEFISGLHTLDGIFIGWGPGFASGKEITGARIIDLAPTILRLMDIAVPEDMDGRALDEALEGVSAARQSAGSGPQAAAGPDDGLSDDEREQIRKELEGLGYV